MNNVGALVQHCQERGCYATAPDEVSAGFLMNKFATITVRVAVPGKAVEPGVTQYSDANGTYRVVYLRFCVNALYARNTYVIYAQLVFPPKFPRAAPIFSVVNTDHRQFVPSAPYASSPLPDGTYAVEFAGAAQWAPNFNAEALFTEFAATLNRHFPLHRPTTPITAPRFPALYDARYNAVPHPSVVSPIQLSSVDHGMSQVSLRDEEEAVARLRLLRQKVSARERAVAAASAQGAQEEAFRAQCASLAALGEKVSAESLEKLIVFERDDEALVLRLRARQSACQDAAAFLETVFAENESVAFEDAVRALDVAWKGEFDAALWLSELRGAAD